MLKLYELLRSVECSMKDRILVRQEKKSGMEMVHKGLATAGFT